jgi:hypothetical protein
MILPTLWWDPISTVLPAADRGTGPKVPALRPMISHGAGIYVSDLSRDRVAERPC